MAYHTGRGPRTPVQRNQSHTMPASPRAHRLVAMTKNRLVGARLGADRVAARYGCALTALNGTLSAMQADGIHVL